MKKPIAVLLSLVMLMGLASCRPKTPEEVGINTNGEENEERVTESEEGEHNIEDFIVNEGYYEIGEVAETAVYSMEIEGISIAYYDGGKYVLADIKFTNFSGGSYDVNDTSFRAYGDNCPLARAQAYDLPVIETGYFMGMTTLNNGRSIRGICAFRYYENFEDLQIQFGNEGVIFEVSFDDLEVAIDDTIIEETEPTTVETTTAPTETTPVETVPEETAEETHPEDVPEDIPEET